MQPLVFKYTPSLYVSYGFINFYSSFRSSKSTYITIQYIQLLIMSNYARIRISALLSFYCKTVKRMIQHLFLIAHNYILETYKNRHQRIEILFI